MLDVAPTELLVLGVVALLVIPPKDLPRAMRIAGQWMSRARGMARQFRSGFDDMIRESEFAEMEKKWKAENERIMREFPQDQTALMAPMPQIDDLGDLPPVESPTMTTEPDPQPVAVPKKPRARAKPKADPKNAGIERL
ncbi:MAG: Sec-independent protein translocase protein TatB [Pseudomonadota bacterium]